MNDDPLQDEEFVQQLRATFLDELHIHVGSLGRDLLALENNPSAEERSDAWTSVFRSAHTLKGASAVVDIEPIHVACHRMEDLFEIYRQTNESLSPEMTSTLLKIVDAMEEMGMRLRAEQELDGAPLLDWIPILQRIADAAADGESIDAALAEVSKANSSRSAAPPSEADEEDDFDFDEPETASTSTAAPKLNINPALLPIFLEELEDRCSKITEDAIAMETVSGAEQEKELLDNLFRSAHSLKGAAGVVKLTPVQTVCHALEDELVEIRDGDASFTTETASRLLEAVDAIRDAGDRLRLGEDLEDSQIVAMAQRIEAAQLEKPAATAEKTRSDKPSKPGTQPQADKQEAKTKKPTTATGKPKAAEPSKVRKTETAEKPTTSAAAALAEHASIRVPAQKLDALLSHSGELLVARNRLDLRAKDALNAGALAVELRDLWRKTERGTRDGAPHRGAAEKMGQHDEAAMEKAGSGLNSLASQLESLARGMESDNRFLNQTCDRLGSEVMHVRMLPFSDACGGLQRAVRDIATSTNKKIKLKLEGSDVEVDRSVLEGLKDPLLHLVRNAADHGVESPKVREAAGKPALATITVSAALRGAQVEVLVQDDGGGLDLERICEIARNRELEVPDDPREQARLIFHPGFSTAKMITDISGRGVGLDVVQNQVEQQLHGSVEISYRRGQGTCFTLNVPLTLTTIRTMLVVAAGQVYAIPTTAVDRLERFNEDDIHSSGGRDSLLLGQAPTPVVSLAETLGLPRGNAPETKSLKRLAIVMCNADQRVAMVVDDVKNEQEVLVKRLGSRVRRLRHFSGCTVLADGSVALVVSPANVVRSALGQRSSPIAVKQKTQRTKKERPKGPKSLLLAEDTVTTRVLLKNILETAGYAVTTAPDGQKAWQILQDQPFDILVTDVDMPNMNGFDLTGMVRHYDPLANLPVVLVTARGSNSDKQRGLQVGANAYIVKGNFEQQVLLETIAQLV